MKTSDIFGPSLQVLRQRLAAETRAKVVSQKELSLVAIVILIETSNSIARLTSNESSLLTYLQPWQYRRAWDFLHLEKKEDWRGNLDGDEESFSCLRCLVERVFLQLQYQVVSKPKSFWDSLRSLRVLTPSFCVLPSRVLTLTSLGQCRMSGGPGRKEGSERSERSEQWGKHLWQWPFLAHVKKRRPKLMDLFVASFGKAFQAPSSGPTSGSPSLHSMDRNRRPKDISCRTWEKFRPIDMFSMTQSQICIYNHLATLAIPALLGFYPVLCNIQADKRDQAWQNNFHNSATLFEFWTSKWRHVPYRICTEWWLDRCRQWQQPDSIAKPHEKTSRNNSTKT